MVVFGVKFAFFNAVYLSYSLILPDYKLLVLYDVKIQLITPIEMPKFQNLIKEPGSLPGLNKGFLTK